MGAETSYRLWSPALDELLVNRLAVAVVVVTGPAWTLVMFVASQDLAKGA